MNRVLRADNALNEIGDLDVLLETMLAEARSGTGADAGSVYTREGGVLSFRHAQNDTLTRIGARMPYSRLLVPADTRSMAGYVAVTGEILNIPDVRRIPPEAPFAFDGAFDRVSGYRTVSCLTLPLTDQNHRVVGVLQLINALGEEGNPIPFPPDAAPFAAHFATLAAVALERALMTRTLLLRMINMAELRDPGETGPHVNRVGACALSLYDAWAAGRGEQEEERKTLRDILRMAAMLHDVGKVGIPDSILRKPGPLDPRERRNMQRHCEIGGAILGSCQTAFDEMAREIALGHHENWDGSGYPRGVSGDTIPFWARIASVADVFDALGSRRCYKDPWDLHRTVEAMLPQFGQKFDPDLREAFLSRAEEMWDIRGIYPEQREGPGLSASLQQSRTASDPSGQ